METSLVFGGNYFVPISQISLPLEVVFPTLGNIFQRNPFLQPVATDFLFNGDDILSFRFSGKPLLKLEGSQYLQKIIWLLEETVFFILFFFRYWLEWKKLFGPVKSHFSRNPSFWLTETDIRLITNWWTQCFKLGVNQFSSSFLIPNRGSSLCN